MDNRLDGATNYSGYPSSASLHAAAQQERIFDRQKTDALSSVSQTTSTGYNIDSRDITEQTMQSPLNEIIENVTRATVEMLNSSQLLPTVIPPVQNTDHIMSDMYTNGSTKFTADPVHYANMLTSQTQKVTPPPEAPNIVDDACMQDRRYWVFFLSSVLTLVGGIFIILIYRGLAFVFSKSNQNGKNSYPFNNSHGK